MANYFTYFSLVFKLKDPESRQYALDLANKATDNRFSNEPVPDHFPSNLVDVLDDWGFETELNDDGIWIHSENGGIDAVCAFIQHLLQQFDPEGRVTSEGRLIAANPGLMLTVGEQPSSPLTRSKR